MQGFIDLGANAAMRLTSMSSSRIMLEFERFGVVVSIVSELFSNILFSSVTARPLR